MRPIHSLAFHPKGDTISPMRRTLSEPFTTNSPPPSVPGKHRASVRMTALSSPARLLTIPLLRVLMKRSKQREPKGEPHATTGQPFWRDWLLCQGILVPEFWQLSATLSTANQLRNWASLISSSLSSSAGKRHWSASWKTARKACLNSRQFTNISNSAETSL